MPQWAVPLRHLLALAQSAVTCPRHWWADAVRRQQEENVLRTPQMWPQVSQVCLDTGVYAGDFGAYEPFCKSRHWSTPESGNT